MKNWRKIFTWLSIALWLVPGLALAQSPIQQLTSFDIFTPPATDRSMMYLGQLFGTVGTVIHGSSGQLVAELFRVFNYAMVIVASAFLIYTVFMSIINTAHEGEFMGRKVNSAWMIVRSITGIGILVPKASGYSLIQIFFMWVVVQGVGLADKAWSHAIDYLNNGGVVYAEPASFTNSNMAATFPKAIDILNSQICMYKLQAIKRQERDTALTALKQDPTNATLKAVVDQPYPIFRPTWDATSKTVSFGYAGTDASSQSICGQYSYNQGFILASVEDYKKIGLEQIISDTEPVAKNWVDISGNTLTDTQKQMMMSRTVNALMGASTDYENIMRPALQKLSNAGKEDWKKALTEAKQKGWMVAGAYYWNIASVNNKLDKKFSSIPPVTVAGFNKDKLIKAGEDGQTVAETVNSLNNIVDLDALKTFIIGLKNGDAQPVNVSQLLAAMQIKDFAARNAAMLDSARDVQSNGIANSLGNYQTENAFAKKEVGVSAGLATALTAGMAANPATTGISFVPAIGVAILGSWYDTMNKPGDPIAMSQKLGKRLIGIATTMWIGGGAFIAGATIVPSSGAALQGAAYAIQNALKLMVPVLTIIIGALFATGMTLAIYVPLIPFMIFTFAAIGWMISVLEALVAAVLVPIGMVHLEGHDFLGKAEQTAMLLLGIFLRPVVMIVGFMAAIVLLRVGLNIINAGFTQAYSSAGIAGSGADLFGMLGLIIVYTMMTVGFINLVCNAGIVTVWRTIWMYIGVSQPDASVEQAVQKVEGGLHSGVQSVGELKKGMVQGGQSAFDGHLSTGDKYMGGGAKGVQLSESPKQ